MNHRVVVMLRGHVRAHLLNKVIRYYRDLNTAELPVEISLLLDRPTKEVKDVVRTHQSDVAQLTHCPFPLISFEGGSRWMEGLALHYKRALALDPTWVIFADDDYVFEDGFREELKTATRRDDIDLWYGDQLFFWEPDMIRKDFFHHRSVIMFRAIKDAEFSRDDERVIMAPANLHDKAHALGRTEVLRSRLLNYGYCGQEERLRVFREFKDVGKIDGVTTKLLDENPVLEPYSGPR